MGKPIIDLTHQQFGRLFVLGRSSQKVSGTSAHWECLCQCGVTICAKSFSLRSGRKQSCGCLYREYHATRGRAIVKDYPGEYNAWLHMRQRCLNPRHKHYQYYGGRGIRIDPRWDDFGIFLSEVGARPSPRHTLDRYPDQNGHYEPGNVRWATRMEQANNTRGNHLHTINGETHTLTEWARLFGHPPFRVHIRVSDGWSIEKALSVPVQTRYIRTKPHSKGK